MTNRKKLTLEEQKLLVEQLTEHIKKLGWIYAIPSSEEGVVSGLIIGDESFVREVSDVYHGASYDLYGEDLTGENSLTEIQDTEEIKNKKPTFH